MPKAIFNIKKLQVSKLTETDNEITYGSPIKVKGTVSLSIDIDQTNTPIYADGTTYFVLQGKASTTGTLENYFVPIEVLKEIFRYIQASNGNWLQTDDPASRFGMQFACDDEEGNEVYFTYYDVVATKPGINLQTSEDGATVNAQSLSLTVATIEVNNKNIISSFAQKGDTNYDTYFEKIVLPSIPDSI